MKKSYKIACITSLSISTLSFIIWRVYDISIAELFIWVGIIISTILVWLESLKPKK